MPHPGLEQSLSALRRLARASKRRPARLEEATHLWAQVLAAARAVGVEQRTGGVAFRFDAHDAAARCQLTCVIHDEARTAPLTASEREVAELLCEGRTLAQIARLRGVTINTVKSQVRQIFRKLEVESRVALVRRLYP